MPARQLRRNNHFKVYRYLCFFSSRTGEGEVKHGIFECVESCQWCEVWDAEQIDVNKCQIQTSSIRGRILTDTCPQNKLRVVNYTPHRYEALSLTEVSKILGTHLILARLYHFSTAMFSLKECIIAASGLRITCPSRWQLFDILSFIHCDGVRGLAVGTSQYPDTLSFWNLVSRLCRTASTLLRNRNLGHTNQVHCKPCLFRGSKWNVAVLDSDGCHIASVPGVPDFLQLWLYPTYGEVGIGSRKQVGPLPEEGTRVHGRGAGEMTMT